MQSPVIEPPPPGPTRTRTPPGGVRFPQIGAPGVRTQKDLAASRMLEPPKDPDRISPEEMAAAWTKMHTHAMQLLLKCMADHHNQELIQTYSIGDYSYCIYSSYFLIWTYLGVSELIQTYSIGAFCTAC